jgi:hypothetical protein
MRGCAFALACGATAACRADEVAHAELAAICGEDEGPLQVLALATDEVVSAHLPSQRIDERWYYGIRRFDHPITDVGRASGLPSRRGYAELDARIESIDRCGSDRRVLAEGVDVLFPPTTEDEPWLARRSETGDLFWIDPDGAWPPRRIATTPALYEQIVLGHVVYTFDADTGELSRYRLEPDGVHSELVRDGVAHVDVFDVRHFARSASERVLARLDDGRLVELTLASGRMETIVEGVDGFWGEVDGRWLAWWPALPEDSTDRDTRVAWLLDRETGETRSLAFDDGAELSVAYLSTDLIATRRVEPIELSGQMHHQPVAMRLTLLPAWIATTIEGDWLVQSASADRVVVTTLPTFFAPSNAMPSGSYVYDRSADGLELVGGPFPPFARVRDDALWYSECAAEPDASTRFGPPCDLIRVALDTLQPEVVRPRAWTDVELPGDRWLAWDGPADDPTAPNRRGTLWVLDGGDGQPRRLADDVAEGWSLLEPHDDPGSLPWQTDEIVYQVRSLTSDRTGLWRAAFAD